MNKGKWRRRADGRVRLPHALLSVARGLVRFDVLAKPSATALIASKPAPVGKVGFHHYFEDPSSLPVADRVLRESGVLSLASELVAPHTIDHAFEHIQIATSIHGWDHQPGGPDAQGGHACLLDEPPDFGRGEPVLAQRGDVLLAHYLLAHNQSGNMRYPPRRIAYYRLPSCQHRASGRAGSRRPE